MKWIRPAVSILLLALLFKLVDLNEVIGNLLAIPTGFLAVALLLFSLSVVVSVYKWKVCLPAAHFRTLFRSYLTSLFLFLLPTGTLGAEISKLAVARSDRIPLPAVAASIALDKLTGLAALALVGSVAGFLATIPYAKSAAAVLLLAALAAMAMVIAAGPFSDFGAPWRARGGVVRRKLLSLTASIAEIGARPGLIWRSLAIGIVAQGVMVAIYACLATGLGLTYPLPELVLCVVIANLVSILPITLGGLGVRELGLVALLAELGIGADASTALALAVFGIFLVGAAAGFVNQLVPEASPTSDA